jgi:RES domain-containing protein
MDLWRLCRRPYADLSGEGARTFGGRWNSPGRPVVYFAEHPALAALEVRVHLDLPFDLLPNDYVLMQVSLADRIIGRLAETVSSPRTVAAGDTWLAEQRSVALRVPSVLVAYAWNILFNPRHPNAGHAHIVTIKPFNFDPRLWQPLATEG